MLAENGIQSGKGEPVGIWVEFIDCAEDDEDCCSGKKSIGYLIEDGAASSDSLPDPSDHVSKLN